MTTATTLQRIPLEQLHESPLNPRKHYDEVALKQLAESLVASGQITPITVRPSRNGKGGYEIAAGHRRARAARQAGIAELDAVVRDDLKADDAAFIEILNVENLQRDDLHPLEEAQGFRTLMEKAGYDIPKIAARIGKSTKYVYDRLKLLQLIKPAQVLFLEGKFEAGHAIILARLSKDDQKRALESDDYAGEIPGLFRSVDGGFIPHDKDDRVPVSVRELQHWVDTRVRLAPEAEEVATLFPETAQALSQAKEAALQVVQITRDWHVDADAKAKDPIYTHDQWRRADGQPEPSAHSSAKTKTCPAAVQGVVVLGEGRGEAFKVCVEKACRIHWEAEKPASRASSSGSSSAYEKKYREQQQQQAAERARWTKAAPRLVELLAEKLKAAPAHSKSPVAHALLAEISRYERSAAKKKFSAGTTAEDVVRLAGFMVIASKVSANWVQPAEVTKALAPFGINARKVVDEVAPKPAKKGKAKKPAGKKTAAKRLAGDVRRAKKAKVRK